MKKHFFIFTIACALLTLSSCNDSYLDLLPETQITKENFFKSQTDLEIYIQNLYNFSSSGIYEADAGTDNAGTTGNNEMKNILLGNVTAANMTTGWDWEQLRKVNFFLENFRSAQVSEEVLAHYEGLARYFRARFYVAKVQRFSDVPWIDQVVNTNDEEILTADRGTRAGTVEKIMEDFQYAADHVLDNAKAGQVGKWVVVQEFGRFALYEGTFRKYHNELNLTNTADAFITKSHQLSEQIIRSGKFAIHATGNPDSDYGDLFFNQSLEGNREVIMGRFFANNVLNASDWPGMFGNYEYYPLRDLMQNYLMKDGSFYTNQSGYQQFSFVQEFQNRDPRLSQTYAYPGWELIYNSTYTQGVGIYVQQLAKNFSGYHQIKGFMNTTDQQVRYGTDVPIYRYAEVLLNYAEAKAELGILTQDDLDISINPLRDRVAMPKMLMSQVEDARLASQFPTITSSQKALLLEIRRERRVELALEGYRLNDIMRWNAGSLLEKMPEGIYFSGLGRHDVTGDGIPDIVLLPANESIPVERERNSLGRIMQYYRVGTYGQDVGVYLSEGTRGFVQTVERASTFEAPKYYYRPIPQDQVNLNNNLKQIFGW
ncbi:RagB/SusD family nutrient uptake outer membrane protein [Sphingobacterium sp. lm-10]|uniref:RagB/SusD family nutrient uptake outer membrane protein n=1 Tax=Sphingobacterium sp. lm-10 TaxID=2944904 RepID=UPI0020224134|nr:RagB/SusD family nutrient uptake outer membrane protein [Sphingobacterium sp. lm-10]MCL7989231.1 RagB/SusD family nutrient uptake outer membrane protein [Sphingobacterium sp. lm-10]